MEVSRRCVFVSIVLSMCMLSLYVLSNYHIEIIPHKIGNENTDLGKENPNLGKENTNLGKENTNLGKENTNLGKVPSYDKVHIDDLIYLAKEIREAKQHVRGTKTGDALIRAQKRIAKMLKRVDVTFEKATKRKIQNATSVCQEVYKGMRFGYYFYDTGFVVESCTYGKPINELVTIVILYNNHQTFPVDNLIDSIRQYNKHIPVIFGNMKSDDVMKSAASGRTGIHVMNFRGEVFEGKVWNKMISNVTTPYILVARDVMWFNHDARVDRLIRQIERLNVLAAGGSYRDVSGHWTQGCQQRVYRNFTLVYEAGYDESIEECMICDHIDGPFVSKTKVLKEIKFNNQIESQGLFEEFFYRLSKKEHVVCPDSMFYTNRTERSYNPKDWKSFQQQWKVYKIKFSGKEILLPKPTSYGCYSKGTSLSPWCQQELADLLYAAMKVCKDERQICELDSGSVNGVVKFHSVLPWERDADIVFISGNFTTLKNAKPKWTSKGYKLSIEDSVKCCDKKTGRKSGGYFGLRSKNWRLEMWGMPDLQTEPKYIGNTTPTLCNMDGHWVRGPRNPGLWSRNRYGKEIYRHAEHWGATGGATSWKEYKTNFFSKCYKAGAQNCLDRYNGDGNLQFRDPIP